LEVADTTDLAAIESRRVNVLLKASVKQLASVCALAVLMTLFRAASAPGQDIRALRRDGEPAFDHASSAALAAAQAKTLENLTAAVQKLIRRVDHGDVQQAAVEALQNLQSATVAQSTTPIRFRVGMFFEDVTLRVLSVFSEYWAGRSCDATLVRRLDNEVNSLGSEFGNGAIFGRPAVAAIKKRCNI
jgi:hypothetical protein